MPGAYTSGKGSGRAYSSTENDRAARDYSFMIRPLTNAYSPSGCTQVDKIIPFWVTAVTLRRI